MEQNNNSNAYAPPQARVADHVPEKTLLLRPKQVTIAIWLIWISLLAPFIVRRAFYAATGDKPLINDSMVFIMMGLNVVLYTLISIGLLKGKNWVRITNLVFLILGTLGVLQTFTVSNWFGRLHHSSYLLAFSMALSQLLAISSVVLLFTKPGSEWFRKSSN